MYMNIITGSSMFFSETKFIPLSFLATTISNMLHKCIIECQVPVKNYSGCLSLELKSEILKVKKVVKRA